MGALLLYLGVALITCLFFLNSNYPSLLCDRHLDQLLLCSVYLACKLYGLGISFTEIIRVYRALPAAHASHIYRKVLVTKCPRHSKNRSSDLVIFYNETFIRVLRPFAFRLNEMERARKQRQSLMKKSQSMGDLVCLSPVPKLQTPAILQTHFTPVKLNTNDESNVFVSPGNYQLWSWAMGKYTLDPN